MRITTASPEDWLIVNLALERVVPTPKLPLLSTVVEPGNVVVPVKVALEKDWLLVRATVPVVAGKVIVFVPATAAGARVIAPEVEPLRVRFPMITPPSKSK